MCWMTLVCIGRKAFISYCPHQCKAQNDNNILSSYKFGFTYQNVTDNPETWLNPGCDRLIFLDSFFSSLPCILCFIIKNGKTKRKCLKIAVHVNQVYKFIIKHGCTSNWDMFCKKRMTTTPAKFTTLFLILYYCSQMCLHVPSETDTI